MKKISYITLGLSVFTPIISFAALGGLKSLIQATGELINMVIPVMFGFALIYFFWGLISFITNSGDEKLREAGKQKMLWGIVALFVFVSIFGILRWIGSTVGIEQKGFINGFLDSSGNDSTLGPGAGDCEINPFADGCQ